MCINLPSLHNLEKNEKLISITDLVPPGIIVIVLLSCTSRKSNLNNKMPCTSESVMTTLRVVN